MSVINATIKENFAKYLKEIPQLLDSIQKYKESKNEKEFYTFNTRSLVERYDRLNRDLEDYLLLNKIREENYPYTIRFNYELHEIFMPATKASDVIGSIQKSVRLIDENIKLNLVNILRGSTILCFDFDETSYDNEKLDLEDATTKYRQVCRAITANNTEESKKIINDIIRDEKKSMKMMNALKKLTPLSGDSLMAVNFSMPLQVEEIIFTDETRKNINLISPSSKSKDVRVDWENNSVTGFVRELNYVTKSFIIFENENDDNEDGALIKIHYLEDSFGKLIHKRFNTKISVKFSKEKNKYFLETIN
jgi:exonuclease VII large subunit